MTRAEDTTNVGAALAVGISLAGEYREYRVLTRNIAHSLSGEFPRVSREKKTARVRH